VGYGDRPIRMCDGAPARPACRSGCRGHGLPADGDAERPPGGPGGRSMRP